MAEPKHHTLIKHFEDCRLTAYLCSAGKPTIGWGHTGPDVTLLDVKLRRTITQADADNLFASDVRKFERVVERLVTNLSLLPQHLGALTSFAFNLGEANLASSTLLKLVNKGDLLAAANEFPKWRLATVNGKKEILPGLVRRRAAEQVLFQTGRLNYFNTGSPT